MYKILVVEDEINILKLMEYRLQKSGFSVLKAQNGCEALDVLKNENVDIIIADIMMPKMNGYELVKVLRDSDNNIPVIFTTAKETISDKTEGYKLGVDDYMVKPINHEELVLRINAVLRRTKPYSSSNLVIGNIVLDYDNLTIKENDLSVSLTKREFELLFMLLSNLEHTFTKNELLNNLWGFNCDIYEETLKVHVNRVRNKIKPFAKIDIQTVRGLGYKGVINE